ncbi:hypothetical protein N7486_005050 [Penicillium sp. IBT 16267x]|nr:hypothetical protein N7486_005050 [Penicillium sp. IBT 16267x]
MKTTPRTTIASVVPWVISVVTGIDVCGAASTAKGSINESWADLLIWRDETTGRPVILECRREWSDNNKKEFLAEHGEGDITYLPPLPISTLLTIHYQTVSDPKTVSVSAPSPERKVHSSYFEVLYNIIKTALPSKA